MRNDSTGANVFDEHVWKWDDFNLFTSQYDKLEHYVEEVFLDF